MMESKRITKFLFIFCFFVFSWNGYLTKSIHGLGSHRRKRHIIAALKSQDVSVLNNRAVVADKPLWPGWGFGTLVGNPTSPNVPETPAMAANAYKTLSNYKGTEPGKKIPNYPGFMTASTLNSQKPGIITKPQTSFITRGPGVYYFTQVIPGDASTYQKPMMPKQMVKTFASSNRNTDLPAEPDYGSKWQVTKDRLDEAGLPVKQAGMLGIDFHKYPDQVTHNNQLNIPNQFYPGNSQIKSLEGKLQDLKNKGVISQAILENLLQSAPLQSTGNPIHSNRITALPDEPDWGSKWQVHKLKQIDGKTAENSVSPVAVNMFPKGSNRNVDLPEDPDWGSRWQAQKFQPTETSIRPNVVTNTAVNDQNTGSNETLLQKIHSSSTRVGDVKVTYNGSMTIVEQTVIIPGIPPPHVNYKNASAETTPSPVVENTPTTATTPYWWNTETTPTTPNTPTTSSPTTVSTGKPKEAIDGASIAKNKQDSNEENAIAQELGLSKRYLTPLNRYARHRNPIFDMQAGDTMAFSNYQILGNQDVVFKSWVPASPKRRRRRAIGFKIAEKANELSKRQRIQNQY